MDLPTFPLSNVVSSDGDTLLKKQSYVKYPDILTSMPITSESIQVSTSIISAFPESVSEFLNNPESDMSNIRSINLVRHVNATLVGDSCDPSVSPIKRWSDGSSNYFPGSHDHSINNNVDHYNVNRYHLLKKVRDLNIKDAFPGGVVSPSISFDMSEYSCYEGKNQNGLNFVRSYLTCYELINELKKQSNANLTTIPDLVLTDFSNITWTNYNFSSALAVTSAVQQLISTPLLAVDPSEPEFNVFSFFDGIRKVPLDSEGNPVESDTPVRSVVTSSGDTAFAFLKNENSLFRIESTNPSNYISFTNTIVVNPFKENQTDYVDKQYLLKVHLITQVYFDQLASEEFDQESSSPTHTFSPGTIPISPL